MSQERDPIKVSTTKCSAALQSFDLPLAQFQFHSLHLYNIIQCVRSFTYVI